MIRFSIDRKEIRKVCRGKNYRASVKTVPGAEKSTEGLMNILNRIINRRYLGRKR